MELAHRDGVELFDLQLLHVHLYLFRQFITIDVRKTPLCFVHGQREFRLENVIHILIPPHLISEVILDGRRGLGLIEPRLEGAHSRAPDCLCLRRTCVRA